MERVTPVDHRVDAPAAARAWLSASRWKCMRLPRGPLHELEGPLAPQDVGLQRRHPAAVARLVGRGVSAA